MYSKIITAVVLSAAFVAPAMASPTRALSTTSHHAFVGAPHGNAVGAPHGKAVGAPHGAFVSHGGSNVVTKTH
jgi:hypothetical protein